ncbi:MAG: cytochrome C [Ignavibacteriae bacterium]|nr:cytochrome C [Ignavibacteria bacterium]MBI3363679.1 cytochrome C [Ignavibacteriota bacterium]
MRNLWVLISKPDNIPIVGLLFLVILYTWYSLSKALKNDRQGFLDESTLSEKIQVWPNLVRVEFLGTLFVMVVLVFWSFLIDAPLEEPANPTLTPNPSKAPWYFLGLQEMLVYFDPWIAGVVLPTFIILGLMAIPYIDINEKGNGYYTFKERSWSILIFCFGFIVLWVSLIVLGTFWRGPGWYFFFPWEPWDTHRVVALTNIDLSEFFGVHTRSADYSLNPAAFIFGAVLVLGYYSLIPLYWILKKDKSGLLKKLGPIRYNVTAFLFLTMMSLPIKMVLRIGFNIKYVWVTPWFNI